MTDVVQCSRTLAVHFAPAVYRSVGSAQVLPELVKSLDIANVQCIQFVPSGIVRVTFKESAQCDAALAGGVSFRGAGLRVTPVDARTRLVYLRDLPAEVPDEPVRAFFRKFGVLHSLSPQFHPGWPDVKNGTRVAKVTLSKDLPSSVRIAGFDARLWYQGQPQSCPVCRQFGHHVRDCPLNGLCRRCHQPGHMARECSSRRPSVDPVPDASTDTVPSDPAAGVDHTMSDDEDDPDYVPSSASEPGSCSGDEETLRSIPTSVLAARARKRSAPPAVPSDESSVDPRDNDLSPASTVDPVPGTPESASTVTVDPAPGTPVSASAVVASVPDPVDPVPGMPESASAVVVPDSTPASPAPKPRKKKPRSSQPAVASSPAKSSSVKSAPSTPVVKSSATESTPVVTIPAKSTSVPRPPAISFWDRSRRTGFGYVVDDGTGASVHFDFGRLSQSIECESTTFEYDRFVKYVHHGFGHGRDVGRTIGRPQDIVCLFPGIPREFPKPPK